MPRLTIRGLSAEQICRISSGLASELAGICECPEDHFTLECVNHTAIFAGKITETYPFIEVAWFDRGAEVRGRVARAITDHVIRLGLAEVEVAFIAYEKDAYYINGTPCG